MRKRLVYELMNPDVVCARPGSSVRDVAQLLVERRVGGAPVVSDDGRVLGIVSLNDLVRHSSQRITVSEAGHFHTDEDDYRDLAEIETDLSDTPVEKVMKTRIYTVPRDASAAVAAHVMRERGIHRLLVTERGRLVGIVTALDLMRVVEEAI